MQLLSIKADNFRNFSQLAVDFHPRMNLFFGENGSGKTSLLEMIFYLAYGKSFRTHIQKRIIQEDQTKFVLFSRVNHTSQTQNVGVEKFVNGESCFKLAGNEVSIAELTALLPVQLLNNDSFLLLTEGPTVRRQFIDWGVFHVEPTFLADWRNYQRALKQRNLALKIHAPIKEVRAWDSLLIKTAENITLFRQNYVNLFIEQFIPILSSVFNFPDLNYKFHRGWSDDSNLESLFTQYIDKDMQLGFTYYGAHRADLKFTLKSRPIEDVLSRGQQKIFVWLMRLTQALILNQVKDKQVIILVDDLAAELDSTRIEIFSELLDKIQGQLFITAINSNDLRFVMDKQSSYKLFHVEHNNISLKQDR